MKTKIVIAILLLFTLPGINRVSATIITSGKSQVVGKILNIVTKEPFEDANVELFSATDSSLIAGTISDCNGFFKIFRLDTGRYYLIIDSRDFKSHEIFPFSVDQQTGKIDLGEFDFLPAANKAQPRKRANPGKNNLTSAILAKE
jgi:hypothetical protein